MELPLPETGVSSNPGDLEDCLNKLSLQDKAENLPEDAEKLLEDMKKLDCPFTWFSDGVPPSESIDFTISRCEEKAEEIMEDELGWRVFILNMVLCHEYTRKGLLGEAMSKHRLLDAYTNKVKENDEDNTKDVNVSMKALKLVSLSCKCFLDFRSKCYGEAKVALQKAQAIELTETEQATMWGTRGAVYMEYGISGTKMAPEFLEKAITLEPKQGEWHFLLGKSLGRTRRVENYTALPDDKEMGALEMAIACSQRVSYILFMAQALREASKSLFAAKRTELDKYRAVLEKLNDRSVELYRKALELGKNSSHVNIRCGLGLLKLPGKYQDPVLAESCIETALKLAPNNAMALHAAGYLYERKGELTRAKFYYEQAMDAGAFGASMDLAKLRYQEDPKYDPLPDMERLLQRYTEKARREEILCQMGSYHYFIQQDFPQALVYWGQVRDEDPDSNRLEVHKCTLLRMKAPVNIHSIIFDEARLFLKGSTGSPKERKSMRSLVIKYAQKHPEFIDNSPISHREKVFEEIREIESRYSKSRFRGRGRGRSRRGRGGRTRGQQGRTTIDNNQTFSRGRGHPRSGRNRESSGDNHPRERYNSKGGSRDSSADNHPKQYYNRDGRIRDSSTENQPKQYYNSRGGRSRDSSSDSRRRGYQYSRDNRSKEFSGEDHSREFYLRGSRSRDSSVDSKDSGLSSRSGIKNWRDEQSRYRTSSQSSLESGSSVTRDWKLGCSGGGRRGNGNWFDRSEQGRHNFPQRGGENRFFRSARNHGSRESSVDSHQGQNRGGRKSTSEDFNRNWRHRPEGNSVILNSEQGSPSWKSTVDRHRTESTSSNHEHTSGPWRRRQESVSDSASPSRKNRDYHR